MMRRYTLNVYLTLDEDAYSNRQLEKLVIRKLEERPHFSGPKHFEEVDCEVMDSEADSEAEAKHSVCPDCGGGWTFDLAARRVYCRQCAEHPPVEVSR